MLHANPDLLFFSFFFSCSFLLSQIQPHMDEQVPIIPPGDIPVPQIPPTIHKSDWAPLIVATTLLFILVVFTLSRFGNIRSQPWYVTVVCTIGWFFPFWIVFLLPLDLASVSESKKKSRRR